MCDEKNQLPNSSSLFGGNTAGGSWVVGGNDTLRQCPTCHFWYTGYHGCTGTALAPNAGFAAFPQPMPVRAQTGLTPHVCPVCTGKVETVGEGREACPACNGACVLWG